MSTINLAERLGTDISSRRNASVLRREIAMLVCAGQGPAVVDFGQVESVSDSFLDELFGVAVLEFGKPWFRENIRLVNLSPDDRKSILRVIQRRVNEPRAPLRPQSALA